MELAMEAVNSYCSSDDEVLFGPITTKEIRKALTLRRQTKVLECADVTPGDTSADKKEAVQNLTFPLQPPRHKEHLTKMWKRRSLDIPFDCNMNDDSEEAETPAPPPSPEFSGYNGSPYPTPCHTRQQPYVNLGGIAEEEGCADEVEEHSSPAHLTFFPRYSDIGQFSTCKDAHTVSYSSVGFNESVSILSNMDDSLVENTARLSLVPVVTCRETVEASATDEAFTGETQKMSDEDMKARDMLIEKMEQHDALTRQLRSVKKQHINVPDDYRKPLSSKVSNDDIVTLNDVENDFSSDEDGPDSPEVRVLSDDSLEVISSVFESSGENYQPLMVDTSAIADKLESCNFSRLISEGDFISPIVKTVGCHDSLLSKSTLVGDLERQYGRQKVDQALAALGCLTRDVGTSHNNELDDAPLSPEFDIKIPEQTESVPCNISYNKIVAEYSLISDADDCSETSVRDDGNEELNGDRGDVRNNVMVSADEDGGFLSVLSEAALYHATLKQASDKGINVALAENTDMYSQDVLEELNCASASTALHCVREEYDNVQKRGQSHETNGKFMQEGRVQGEPSGLDLRNKSVDDYGDNSISVIQECSVLDDDNMGSCIREMDAKSDLNENDRKNIENVNNLESSCEEGFNDTLEEMEMLLKFGMDYMMSGNNTECPDRLDERSLFHSVSTPKKPLTEKAGFEDFGDPIRFRNVVEISNEDCSKASTEREVCASGLLIKSRVPSSQGVPCDGVATPSTSGILFPKPTTTLGKFHSKMETVSPVVNLGGEKPSAFKVPVKPLFHGTHIPKLRPPRNAKKSPLKPIKVVSPCKRPLGYNTIVSPVGAYIHNTPSPALVTNVKPKLCRAATPKRAMVGRGATVMPRHDFASAIAKTHLEIPYKVEERGTENVNTSNIRPILPIVSYSSVPSVILEEPQLERMPRLNKKMKKLLDAPKPRVFRHEGRVKVVPSPRTRNANAASRAVTSDADGDISVVVEKQVTRSNTLGV
ncbi:uncharacterized protein LOC110840190 isoform X2 [Zootermopsis nevadensis]|uniref:uncharacterized protein LOC110840190 isoform X2 n=1 Tax=Zootermopsis nevadensis TaxID=136037 RepID=UPI000B8E590B|nr:uncharacterized protein LOC110840190 isoform X2 [Zootermopsis nevadensis]XP_021940731.1 uncharacterized protein LOC110840190 isoform X2 [Zootermopsis nevadensis]XP_021940732.1 uncharacterized protein LOC110840190 isoform X2 [Zootermopsis nevadensis]